MDTTLILAANDTWAVRSEDNLVAIDIGYDPIVQSFVDISLSDGNVTAKLSAQVSPVNDTANISLSIQKGSNTPIIISMDSDAGLQITGIPTSSEGLQTGSLWNNNGVLSIVS